MPKKKQTKEAKPKKKCAAKAPKKVPEKKWIRTNVPEGKEFYLKDGTVISNLKDFVLILHDMNDDVFGHHVNEEKDDFSSWVNDVMKDKKLAGKISKKNRSETYHEVLRHIINKI